MAARIRGGYAASSFYFYFQGIPIHFKLERDKVTDTPASHEERARRQTQRVCMRVPGRCSDRKLAASRYCHESGLTFARHCCGPQGEPLNRAFCLPAFFYSRYCCWPCKRRPDTARVSPVLRPNPRPIPRVRDWPKWNHFATSSPGISRFIMIIIIVVVVVVVVVGLACVVCMPVARIGSRCSRDNISSRLRSVFVSFFSFFFFACQFSFSLS